MGSEEKGNKERKYRPLKKIMDSQLFTQINPRFENGEPIIPYYGKQDSRFLLVGVMVRWFGLSEERKTRELYKEFLNSDKETQLFLVYSLSHELKIATLGVSIALSNRQK